MISNLICRTCMSKDERLESIFIGETCSILNSYFKLQISQNDGLPDQICISCLYEINRWKVFGENCKKSDGTMRDILDLKKVENEVKVEVVCEVFDLNIKKEETLSRKGRKKFNSDGQVECHYCGTTLATKKALLPHFKLCRGRPRTAEEDDQQTCRKCDAKFFTLLALKNHISGNKCGEKAFICNVCHCTFAARKSLRRHHVLHLSLKHEGNLLENVNKRTTCRLCSVKHDTKEIEHKIKHYFEEHGTIAECKDCGNHFDELKMFFKHIKSQHGDTEKESLQCDICNRVLGNKYILKEHRLIHLNKKSLLCRFCGMGFNTDSTLRSHEKRHVEIKPFSCSICPKRFYTSTRLKSHVRVHTGDRPFKCDLCLKSYTASYTLTTHLMKHRGEYKYNCDFCSKRFISHNHLKVHRRTHTGERPYACDYCGSNFSQKHLLTSHLRRHGTNQAQPIVQ